MQINKRIKCIHISLTLFQVQDLYLYILCQCHVFPQNLNVTKYFLFSNFMAVAFLGPKYFRILLVFLPFCTHPTVQTRKDKPLAPITVLLVRMSGQVDFWDSALSKKNGNISLTFNTKQNFGLSKVKAFAEDKSNVTQEFYLSLKWDKRIGK